MRTAALTVMLVIGLMACDTLLDNPPERPTPPGASASAEEIAAYEQQHAEYEDYWDAHERGYDDGRHRTCNAAEQVIAGSSLSRAKEGLDKYQDELPKGTATEQAYAKGFAEGREFVGDVLDSGDATWFDLAFVCQ